MPRFAANLTTMFPEVALPQRFAAARDAGFQAVEILFPYTSTTADLRRWLSDAGLDLILINTAMGDPARGERGLACVPGREADFRGLFDQALEYAGELGAGMIHVMAGKVGPDDPLEKSEQTFVENLALASRKAAEHGVKLMLEPLNHIDVPGYLHSTSLQTRVLIDAIGDANVQLQFDCYHLQITEGNLVAGLRDNFDVLGHVQFSSVPGRHEPQYGEVNMPVVFDALDEMGYEHWVSCEYFPKTTTSEGLTWGAPYGLGRL